MIPVEPQRTQWRAVKELPFTTIAKSKNKFAQFMTTYPLVVTYKYPVYDTPKFKRTQTWKKRMQFCDRMNWDPAFEA